MQYIFIFTLGITILNLLIVLSILCHNKLIFPSWKEVSPSAWWLFYPSFFYQVYWWSVKLGLIAF